MNCASCGEINDTEFSNFCSVCAGKAFYGKKVSSPMTETEQLLKLSILYHRLLSGFEQVIGRSLTQGERSRAFQLLSDVGDELKLLWSSST